MHLREVRVALVLAMLIGVAILYLGATGSCACPAQLVGQPALFNQFQAEVAVGLVIIIASVIGLALSSFYTKRRGTAQSGTEVNTT